ncbi:MAG: hypothetical protein QM528_05275 [Phycisphaerales bacterium]|nr:hypothetical protein [Phycisphaerales bacterium]
MQRYIVFRPTPHFVIMENDYLLSQASCNDFFFNNPNGTHLDDNIEADYKNDFFHLILLRHGLIGIHFFKLRQFFSDFLIDKVEKIPADKLNDTGQYIIYNAEQKGASIFASRIIMQLLIKTNIKHNYIFGTINGTHNKPIIDEMSFIDGNLTGGGGNNEIIRSIFTKNYPNEFGHKMVSEESRNELKTYRSLESLLELQQRQYLTQVYSKPRNDIYKKFMNDLGDSFNSFIMNKEKILFYKELLSFADLFELGYKTQNFDIFCQAIVYGKKIMYRLLGKLSGYDENRDGKLSEHVKKHVATNNYKTKDDLKKIIDKRNKIEHETILNENFLNQSGYYVRCIEIFKELGTKLNVYEFDIEIDRTLSGIYISAEDYGVDNKIASTTM